MSQRNSTPDSPGSIHNNVLLEASENRKITVLTGEGGKLKQDVVLIYGKDYQVNQTKHQNDDFFKSDSSNLRYIKNIKLYHGLLYSI